MRKHIKTLLALGMCLTFLFSGCAFWVYASGDSVLTDFTWEGELNPNDFDNWKLLFVQPNPQRYFWVFIENPDRTSAIDVVVLEVDLNSNVLGYRYFKDGEPYLYVFDRSKYRYIRYRFTQDEKKSCTNCHSGESGRDLLHEDMEGI